MPLTWDSTAVEGDLSENDLATRHALTFATMGIGINRITEDNAREVYARLSFYEKVNGAYRFATDENGETSPLFFSPEDVVRFIGFRTNASPMTKAQFYKNVWLSHERWNVPSSMPARVDGPVAV